MWELVDLNGGRGTEHRLIAQFKKKLRTARVQYGKALMNAAIELEVDPVPPKKQKIKTVQEETVVSSEESSGHESDDSVVSEEPLLDPVAKYRYVRNHLIQNH